MGLAVEKEPIYIYSMPFWLCGCLIFFVGLLKLSRLSLKLFERGEWWGIPPSNTQQIIQNLSLIITRSLQIQVQLSRVILCWKRAPSSIIAKIGARRLAFERSDSSIAMYRQKLLRMFCPKSCFWKRCCKISGWRCTLKTNMILENLRRYILIHGEKTQCHVSFPGLYHTHDKE